jgi:hypothetical protein
MLSDYVNAGVAAPTYSLYRRALAAARIGSYSETMSTWAQKAASRRWSAAGD